MIKYFCDRCGTELDIDDFLAIKPGVTENAKKIDLCLMCAVELEDIINSFVKYDVQKSVHCCDCVYYEKHYDDEPCYKCRNRYVSYFLSKEN